jgi:hypothetical protein
MRSGAARKRSPHGVEGASWACFLSPGAPFEGHDRKDRSGVNLTEAAERGAALIERIQAELGPGWTKLPELAGSQKGFVVWDDDTVALASADAEWALYLIDDELWSRVKREDKIVTSVWRGDAFEVTAVTDAPDASLN